MFGIPIEHLIPVANFIGLAALGLLALLGMRWGQRHNPSAEKQIEVAGALVDSGSVNRLTAAIEAYTVESIATRQEGERARRIGHELVEAITGLTRELQEMRGEMRMKRR